VVPVPTIQPASLIAAAVVSFQLTPDESSRTFKSDIAPPAALATNACSTPAEVKSVPDDLAGLIDVQGLAEAPAQRSQVLHAAAGGVVKKRVGDRIAGEGRCADELAGVVDAVGGAVAAAQRAQVTESPAGEEERVMMQVADDVPRRRRSGPSR
jgi:hypothetical protein